MKYRVYLKTETEREVEADNHEAAVKEAINLAELDTGASWKASSVSAIRLMEKGEDGDDEVDHKEVIGHCDACDKLVLEDEEYTENEIFLCAACTELSRREFRDRVTAGKCGACGENPHAPGEQVCTECIIVD